MSKTIFVGGAILSCLLAGASAQPELKGMLAVALTAFEAESNPSPTLRKAAGELLIGVGLNDRIPVRWQATEASTMTK